MLHHSSSPYPISPPPRDVLTSDPGGGGGTGILLAADPGFIQHLHGHFWGKEQEAWVPFDHLLGQIPCLGGFPTCL